MTERKKYSGQPYLRAEHLLAGGKFKSTTLEIADVIYDCPKKVMGRDDSVQGGVKRMLGLEFRNAEKILGLNCTNEGTLCIVTGEGSPSAWIGHKIQLVVFLVTDRKDKTQIPAIRIWPGNDVKLPKRIRDQIGVPPNEEWYRDNLGAFVQKSREFGAPERADIIGRLEASISAAKTESDVSECREKFAKLVTFLDDKKLPLTQEERHKLSDTLSAVKVTTKEDTQSVL